MASVPTCLVLLLCLGFLSVTEAQSMRLRRLERRVDFLTGDILDLKNSVNSLRDQMLPMVNGSEDCGFDCGDLGGEGINDDVQVKLDTLDSSINQLKKSQGTLKDAVNKAIQDADEISKKEIADLKEQLKELTDRLDVLEEKTTKDVHAEMVEFMATIKRAFKEHKFNTLTAIDEIDAKIDKVPKKIDEPKINAKDLEKINNVTLEVSSMKSSMLTMNEVMLATKGDVDDLKKKVDEKLDDCCTRKSGDVDGAEDYPDVYGYVVRTTAATSAGSVSVSPGGPMIKPIYGADLKAHVKIGSRVVRGKDWSWGDQDGGGPGTVDGWYRGAKSSQQVMVTWDKGSVQRANYRIGYLGKYDLYLLA